MIVAKYIKDKTEEDRKCLYENLIAEYKGTKYTSIGFKGCTNGDQIVLDLGIMDPELVKILKDEILSPSTSEFFDKNKNDAFVLSIETSNNYNITVSRRVDDNHSAKYYYEDFIYYRIFNRFKNLIWEDAVHFYINP